MKIKNKTYAIGFVVLVLAATVLYCYNRTCRKSVIYEMHLEADRSVYYSYIQTSAELQRGSYIEIVQKNPDGSLVRKEQELVPGSKIHMYITEIINSQSALIDCQIYPEKPVKTAGFPVWKRAYFPFDLTEGAVLLRQQKTNGTEMILWISRPHAVRIKERGQIIVGRTYYELFDVLKLIETD